MVKNTRFVAAMLLLVTSVTVGQQPVDPLMNASGTQITKAADWPELRDQHRMRAIEYIYGTMPPKPDNVTTKILSSRQVMSGRATETLFVMIIHRGKQAVPVRVGLIRPNTAAACPIVIKNDRWLFDLSAMAAGRKRDQYASEKREVTFVEVSKMAVERGYAICKFVREDLAVDAPHCRQTGVLAMHPEHSWGAIAAWAWGYSPLIDVLLAKHNIDASRIIATGHSRGGKTALAAAIFDERIGISAPSASGSGGTGSMQHFTEGGRKQTCEAICKNHGFWFSPMLAELDSSRPLPIDGHILRALVAPRGIINTQGADDGLANPVGTKMMFDASEPVYKLLDAADRSATHWRSGGHGHTVEDWIAILDYADAFFAGTPIPKRFNNWPSNAQP